MVNVDKTFIIQETPQIIPEDSSYFQYRKSLMEQNLKFEIISLKNKEITFLDNDFIPKDINHTQYLSEITQKPFVPLGSVQLDNLLIDYKNNIFHQSLKTNTALFKIIPKQLWLNGEKQSGKLKDLTTSFPIIFIRPLTSSKIINGQIMNNSDFQKLKESKNKIFESTEFSIAPVQEIKSESRFFIVENTIVAKSNYTKAGLFNKTGIVSEDKTNFVNLIIKIYPAIGSHYVIDVCELADSTLKIVEFNPLQASGIYNSNASDIIQALNKIHIK